MVVFLVRRVVLGVLVLAALSFASFCFFQWLGPGSNSFAEILREYRTWAAGLWGGASFDVLHRPVPTRLNFFVRVTLIQALGHTVALLALTLAIVVVLTIGLAALAASRKGSVLDVTLRALSYLAWAVPAFLLGLLVQLLVNAVGGAHGVGPFPIAGWPGTCPAGVGINSGQITPCAAAGSGVHYVWNALRYLVLPAGTLAVGFVGLHARYLRSALVETLQAPYITTARAKGLAERSVLLRHALRISLVTFVSALLSDFGAILGTVMAVDFVFQLNGLGTVFISDFPVDMGHVDPYQIVPVLLLTGILVVASSVVADVVIFRLDPRARVRE